MPVPAADERDEADETENGPGQRIQGCQYTIRGTISNHAASRTISNARTLEDSTPPVAGGANADEAAGTD